MTHLQFRTELYEALLRNWKGWGIFTACSPTRGTIICFLVQTKLQNPYMVCNDGTLPLIRLCMHYAKCNKYMCLKKGCFQRYHKKLLRIDMRM